MQRRMHSIVANVFFAALVIGGLWAAQNLLFAAASVPQEQANGKRVYQALRIAASGGVGAELLQHMALFLKYSGVELAAEQPQLLEVFSVQDCCAAKTPWAMSTQSLHGAIMCPDAAVLFLAEHKDFVLLGPVLINSDVLVRQPIEVEKGITRPLQVGVAHKRRHQEVMAKQLLGGEVAIMPMLPQALPYALQNRAIDAAVVDISVAGRMRAMPVLASEQDVVTQVLVLHSSFAASPEFQLFAEAYTHARSQLLATYPASSLKLPEHLFVTLQTYEE